MYLCYQILQLKTPSNFLATLEADLSRLPSNFAFSEYRGLIENFRREFFSENVSLYFVRGTQVFFICYEIRPCGILVGLINFELFSSCEIRVEGKSDHKCKKNYF